MKRKHMGTIMLVVVMIFVLLWCVAGMANMGKSSNMRHISVVMNDTGDETYLALKEGMEQAAADYNVLLNYSYTSGYRNAKEQIEDVLNEQENGAQAIILQPVDNHYDEDELLEMMGNTPVVFVKSTFGDGQAYNLVSANNYNIGVNLADEAMGDVKKLANLKIGILVNDSELPALRERLTGLKDQLTKYGIEPRWVLYCDIPNTDPEILTKMLIQRGTVNALIGLCKEDTEALLDYSLSRDLNGSTVHIYGEGCSEKLIYYLDRGNITTLAVPNDYTIGYQSVIMAVKRMNNSCGADEDTEVSFTMIDKQNMYEEENQRLLFPIIE